MKCDGCTLCCKLFNIPWMDSPEGEYCKECEPGKGCKIYNTSIDEKCLSYKCAYNQIDVHTDFKPSNCGIVFEKVNDEIVYGTLDTEFEMNEVIDNQIKSFLEKGISVVLRHLHIKAPIIFNSDKTTADEVWGEIKKQWQLRRTIQI